MSDSNNINEMLEVVAQVLIRCFIMGVVVLFIWWGALQLIGDLAYTVHSNIVPISREQFEVIHYSGMLLTKAAIFILYFFPYLAIRLVIGKQDK